MNNRLIVPVLALGIAALGAAASPAQAETNSLVFSIVGSSHLHQPPSYFWVDNVSLSDSGSTWSDALEYQAQDGGSFLPAYDVPESVVGPGNFYTRFRALIPAPGHNNQTFILNSGSNSSGTWQDLTGIRDLATNSTGGTSF